MGRRIAMYRQRKFKVLEDLPENNLYYINLRQEWLCSDACDPEYRRKDIIEEAFGNNDYDRFHLKLNFNGDSSSRKRKIVSYYSLCTPRPPLWCTCKACGWNLLFLKSQYLFHPLWSGKKGTSSHHYWPFIQVWCMHVQVRVCVCVCVCGVRGWSTILCLVSSRSFSANAFSYSPFSRYRWSGRSLESVGGSFSLIHDQTFRVRTRTWN